MNKQTKRQVEDAIVGQLREYRLNASRNTWLFGDPNGMVHLQMLMLASRLELNKNYIIEEAFTDISEASSGTT